LHGANGRSDDRRAPLPSAVGVAHALALAEAAPGDDREAARREIEPARVEERAERVGSVDGDEVDPRLLRAQSLAESVISVIAGAELIEQARADPGRQDVAASWVDRRMIDLEVRTERIRPGAVDLLDRLERMIEGAFPR
jgi:hypothetical protein